MTLTEPAITEHLARIETDGYSILEGAIEPELGSRSMAGDHGTMSDPARVGGV